MTHLHYKGYMLLIANNTTMDFSSCNCSRISWQLVAVLVVGEWVWGVVVLEVLASNQAVAKA
jgi:hypothetical protein